MKSVELGAIVRYEGKLMEVYAIGDGKTVHLRRLAVASEPGAHLLDQVLADVGADLDYGVGEHAGSVGGGR